ncbi:hypothetical protein UNDYM_4420 [Undibacterium sp. YM2]|nr:hypothetical protein UNDYM_4420 [Undibacterium sp. YM2]
MLLPHRLSVTASSRASGGSKDVGVFLTAACTCALRGERTNAEKDKANWRREIIICYLSVWGVSGSIDGFISHLQ